MNSLRRQVLGFGVSGVAAFFVDFFVYWFLTPSTGTFWAKQASFVAATLVSFFLNKTLSFRAQGVSPWKILLFVVYYTVMAWLNPLTNQGLLDLCGNRILAFVLATGITAGLNFFVMRKFVFHPGVNR